MKRFIKRLLGKLGLISYCFVHDMEFDVDRGYYGEMVSCSKCDKLERKKKK